MKALAHVRTCFFVAAGVLLSAPMSGRAQTDSGAVARRQATPAQDGQHDFDFEFGAWNAHIQRMKSPLCGDTSWVEYEGTSMVRPVWDGGANLGELAVEGPAGRIEGLSLRIYNPQTQQWRIHWASSRDGVLGPAMIGGFKDGRGEFYNQESFNGRAIFVRFIFSQFTPDSFNIEQAFSDDGGQTWEPNWIATFARVSDQVETRSSSHVARTNHEQAQEARGKRADFLARHGWVASTVHMGGREPVLEYRIWIDLLDPKKPALGVVVMSLEENPVLVRVPEGMDDGCGRLELVRGLASEEERFDPSGWLQLSMEEDGGRR